MNHQENLRRSFHLHQTHLQAAFRKAKIIKKTKMSFDVLLVQRTARRLCWLPLGCNSNKSMESHLFSFSKNKGFPLQNTSIKMLNKVPIFINCCKMLSLFSDIKWHGQFFFKFSVELLINTSSFGSELLLHICWQM